MKTRFYLYRGKAKGRVRLNLAGERSRKTDSKRKAARGREPWLLVSILPKTYATAKRVVAIYRTLETGRIVFYTYDRSLYTILRDVSAFHAAVDLRFQGGLHDLSVYSVLNIKSLHFNSKTGAITLKPRPPLLTFQAPSHLFPTTPQKPPHYASPASCPDA